MSWCNVHCRQWMYLKQPASRSFLLSVLEDSRFCSLLSNFKLVPGNYLSPLRSCTVPSALVILPFIFKETNTGFLFKVKIIPASIPVVLQKAVKDEGTASWYLGVAHQYPGSWCVTETLLACFVACFVSFLKRCSPLEP